jgi:hypothetical protein
MKIGVFGDSFAEKNAKDIWWQYLKSNHGHEVECFGESGSSLIFSARKLLEKFHEYDFVIWCVTSSMRSTVWHRANYKEIAVHVSTAYHTTYDDPEIQRKIDATEQYLIHAWDAPDGEFTNACVVEHVQNKVKNLLLIPCFVAPLNCLADIKFNLYDLCQQETDLYFHGRSISDVYEEYQDFRQGHLANSTQTKLAELISKSLIPGIFTADYKDFPKPTDPFEKIFKKHSP